jgi:hypothetical protein
MRVANLALKFLVELCAFAAFAYWGATIGGSVAVNILVGVAAIGVAAGLWAIFAAPKSARRLPRNPRIAFELTVFALAVGALIAAGATTLAIMLAVAIVVNVALLQAFDQWEA